VADAAPLDTDSWRPLDGVPAPEYIPDRWIAPDVGLRLSEAFRTLRNIPMNGHPKAFGNSWPAYAVEWTDQLARLEGDEEQQRQDAARRNWTKSVPTSIEIMRMEMAISWPGRYLGELPQLLRVVGAVAQVKALFGDIPRAARKLGLPGRLVR